jgi:hypothetical protein
MNYTQYRLAKRKGEIVQQSRSVIYTVTTPWWKFWDQQYNHTTFTDWEDIPFLELEPESIKTTVTAAMVKRLREETDRPMMECKLALHACDGDHERAKQWLVDGNRFRSTI